MSLDFDCKSGPTKIIPLVTWAEWIIAAPCCHQVRPCRHLHPLSSNKGLWRPLTDLMTPQDCRTCSEPQGILILDRNPLDHWVLQVKIFSLCELHLESDSHFDRRSTWNSHLLHHSSPSYPKKKSHLKASFNKNYWKKMMYILATWSESLIQLLL